MSKKKIPEWMEHPNLMVAAVLLLLHKHDNEESILLTRRSETVAHHKGQISFPGGVFEENDKDLWHTALREANEEIALPSESVDYIGELSPLVTPTGFRVHPFVGKLKGPAQWKINSTETAEIFSVPLNHFLEPKNFKTMKLQYEVKNPSTGLPMEMVDYFSQEHDCPSFTFKHHQIWGATARILVDFLEGFKNIK